MVRTSGAEKLHRKASVDQDRKRNRVRNSSKYSSLTMENSHYPYMIHQKHPKQHGNWEELEGPTPSQREAESVLSVSCDVCRRTFMSRKALWGHRRCCKAARSDYRNESGCVTGYKHDVLESGWCVTDKRGRKPVISINSPEFVAADILISISSRKNGSVISIQDTEKKIAEMEESHPIGDHSPTISISCGNKFLCVICGKIFLSYQALRGHKARHGKDEMIVNSVIKYEKQVKHMKGLMRGDHRCDVCGESFPSGQALGGHKRKHWTGPSFMTGNRSRASDASLSPASGVACMHLDRFQTNNCYFRFTKGGCFGNLMFMNLYSTISGVME